VARRPCGQTEQTSASRQTREAGNQHGQVVAAGGRDRDRADAVADLDGPPDVPDLGLLAADVDHTGVEVHGSGLDVQKLAARDVGQDRGAAATRALDTITTGLHGETT